MKRKNKNEMFRVKEPKWKKFFSRIQWIFSSFYKETKEYGLGVGWYGLIWWISVYARMPKLSAKALAMSTKYIDSYFYTHYSNILEHYKNNDDLEPEEEVGINDYPIWCFWWQGKDKMPEVVRLCFDRIESNNSNVTLITKDNINEIVKLPQQIYKKVADGNISYTHLSDILRLTLLAEYGGMWIDVTCFNPYTIPNDAKQMAFCSPHDTKKQENRKLITYWCDLGGWRSWNIGTNRKNSILFCFSRDMIQAIAIRQHCMPSYFMVDCLLNFAYRHIDKVRELIDNLPDINTKCADLFLSYFNTNKIWDESEYANLIANDWLFKLTYKTIWKEEVDGHSTFYGKLFSSK